MPRHPQYKNLDVNMMHISIRNVGRPGRQNFPPCFCIDTGAPNSVIGLQAALLLFNGLGRKVKPFKPSQKRFRFPDSTFDSLGSIELPLATPRGIPTIFFQLNVVAADVPALLCLDVLDEYSLIVDTVTTNSSNATSLLSNLKESMR